MAFKLIMQSNLHLNTLLFVQMDQGWRNYSVVQFLAIKSLVMCSLPCFLLQTFDKVKVKSQYGFPLELDLSRYLHDANEVLGGGVCETIQPYELTAVVHHVGPSAHQGHYGEIWEMSFKGWCEGQESDKT